MVKTQVQVTDEVFVMGSLLFSIVRFPFCPLTSAPPVQWQQRRLPQWHHCPGAQLVLHPRLYHRPGHQFVNFRPSASHRATMPKTSYNMFPLLYRVTAVDLTSAGRTESGSRGGGGLTSWGISTCSGSYPSVYTRISSYLSWIANYM